jgi:hypothetical protein
LQVPDVRAARGSSIFRYNEHHETRRDPPNAAQGARSMRSPDV